MHVKHSSTYLRVAFPLAGTPPFCLHGIVLEEAKGEPQSTGIHEGKKGFGISAHALDGEGPPHMRSKCHLQPLSPPCNGPCA